MDSLPKLDMQRSPPPPPPPADGLLSALSRQQANHEHKVEELLKNTSRSLEETLVRAMDMRLQHWCRDLEPIAHPVVHNPHVPRADACSPCTESRISRTTENHISCPGEVEEDNKEDEHVQAVRTHLRKSRTADKLDGQLAQQVPGLETKPSDGTTVPSILHQVETWRHQRDELWRGNRKSVSKKLLKTDTGSSTSLSSIRVVCARFMKTRRFETAVASLIIGSALSIGVQEDWQARNLSITDPPLAFDICGLFINVCFAIELIIRMIAEGSQFFYYDSKNFNWNLFDSFLVLCSIADEVVKRLISNTASGGFGAARLLRLLRLVRVVRIIRVLRVFRELRVMVSGIMSSAKPLAWAIVLLVIIMFVFSVSIMPFVRDELLLISQKSSDAATKDVDGMPISTAFGSLFAAMSTLFLAVSGGVDWGDVARPLSEINPVLAFIFALYVSFALLCVLNIITGVFVETASRLSMMDEDLMVAEEIDTKLSWYRDVKELFDEAILNDDGAMELQEFLRLSGKLRIQSRFRKLGVELSAANAKGVFNLLDIDDSGAINFEEFALGIQQFHGQAKGLDIARIRLDNKKLAKQIANIAETFVKLFDELGFEQSPPEKIHYWHRRASGVVRNTSSNGNMHSISLPSCVSEPTAPPFAPPGMDYAPPPLLPDDTCDGSSEGQDTQIMARADG